MIRLCKLPEPLVLQQNAAIWSATIQAKQLNGDELTKSDRSHYSHADIKAALVEETHGKCAYCESKIRHIAFGDIEHIVPKSIVPARWFDWSNLTIACDVCNTHKGNFVGDHDTFVDPYQIDPDDHLIFMGAVLFPRPGSDAGRTTTLVLKLNRSELLERRGDKLKQLMQLLDVIQRTQDAALRAVLWEDLFEEIKDEKEYAGLAREVLRTAQAKGFAK